MDLLNGENLFIMDDCLLTLWRNCQLIMPVLRFETSAKENTCISECAKYLVDAIVQLEASESSDDSDYEIDYASSSNSTITLNDQSAQINKSDTSKCCT